MVLFLKNKKACFSLILIIFIFASCTPRLAWQKNQGLIFGTSYHLVYESPDGKDLHREVLMALDSVNKSLSTYDSTSVISRFNRSEKAIKTDHHFRTVFNAANEITKTTNGAFDMTVAPLVNAWGFGFENRKKMIPENIDSIKNLVGMDFIELTDSTVIKKKKGVMLDASAIAKGYGVDVAANILKKNGCTNYLVEIGGEVVTNGINPKGEKWRIGIDRPIDDPTASKREIQMVISLSGRALATSGNYRQFYIDNSTNQKYSHTIDPVSGRPVQHTLLSTSIIADNCMEADAYATACMVMGLGKSIELLQMHPEMEGCFIYDTQEGMKVKWTEGFEKFIVEQ